jgi:putative transposase
MRATPFKRIRLAHHDYTGAGAYFVTVCAYEWKSIFGEIVGGEVILNDIGRILEREWLRSGEIRKEIVLDAFVVMPNHLHAIVIFREEREDRAGCRPALRGSREHETRSLSTFIGQFKAVTTAVIRRFMQEPEMRVWQMRFYDRVIRNETELNRMREYILNNPAQWHLDEENSDRDS